MTSPPTTPAGGSDDVWARWVLERQFGPDPEKQQAGFSANERMHRIRDQLLGWHGLLGHSRQILQMDVGGMPHAAFLEGIELLGTRVLPRVREEIDGQIAHSSRATQLH